MAATGTLDKVRESSFAQNGSSVRPKQEVMAAWEDEEEREENRFGEEGWPAMGSGNDAAEMDNRGEAEEEQEGNQEEVDIRVRNVLRMPTREERKKT